MIYKKEYLELIVKPRILRAAKRRPKTILELTIAMGLPPSTWSAVSTWIHELGIPIEDVIDNEGVRKRLQARRKKVQ